MSGAARRILVYSLLIIVATIGFHFVYGKPLRPDRLLPALFLVPFCAFAMWLRWDWRRRR